MHCECYRRIARHGFSWRLLSILGVLIVATGCRQLGTDVRMDDPQLAAFVRLMMPAKIEIQHYLTKPYAFDDSPDVNGVEVILTTLDSFDDPIKSVGTFHFDLYTMRMASGDRLGEQVAHWPVTIDTDVTLLQYWDRLTHSYRFPLKLRNGKLPPGRYILNASLMTPAETKLFDSYEFRYGAR